MGEVVNNFSSFFFFLRYEKKNILILAKHIWHLFKTYRRNDDDEEEGIKVFCSE